MQLQGLSGIPKTIIEEIWAGKPHWEWQRVICTFYAISANNWYRIISPLPSPEMAGIFLTDG